MSSRDKATALVDTAIEEAQGPLPPRFLVKYLLGPWRDQLVRILDRDGEAGSQWQQAVEMTRMLLWSVAPKRNESERKALIAALGTLLNAIKPALDASNWRQPARKLFMSALAAHHVRLIKGDTHLLPRPGRTLVDLTDTVHLDVHDPRYRDYLDALNHAQLENIEIESPLEPIAPARRPPGTGH
jgi:hypothetical protein